MSSVLEQFHAASAAVKSAQEALEALRALLGQMPNGNGVAATHAKPRWYHDSAKQARAIARFKRTMKAKRLARAAALATTGVEG